ncbi:TetR/AcrR family transcriptional regulator [Frankia sp. CNm7]|uniref:TetR/AcrR family transcriptional regulator n=1 Tax=Frankia nepalensis TaxID=1836974 RepID=A0A937RLX7_9ACTN|nr:TetR/AcrR family transcriptional regulator [Frankia nepalensis]MBL7499939.1 TetR/AcrR family transcriptional regulator [Frankia nepalensis]MBL7511698.1 TetR/AcrR family transcriptional regulator [Frankia nepalensis]MBL7523025.1 TetR/AcrR family transcriptional regulator [Frankia nepalensis]MBL7632542.1 TetR/AcrR family transcriptional regulator [Frankia nepalensis]
MTGRRSAADALETRAAILRRAADIGSVEGLDGITIGRLAADLQMSKSGVIGHFGAKEQLQLATLDYAADLFRERVWVPVQHRKPGLERLLAVCASWTRYSGSTPFPGGCFIASTTFEWDGRSGPVHDALAVVKNRWRRTLARDIATAIAAGDLPADTDLDQAVFALEALAFGIGQAGQLHGDVQAPVWALRAMYAVLGVPVPTEAAS